MASILIVDDEESIRAFLNAVFAGTHNIFEAHDGSEGEWLASINRPDIIITDLNMPKLSGLEMISKIRVHDKAVKIVAISSDLNCPAECERVLKAGANRCLPKPVAIATLEKTVATLLAKHH